MNLVDTSDVRALGPVIVCITDTPEERSRLARMFDGVGILVMTSDKDSASSFLEHFQAAEGDEPPTDAARMPDAAEVSGTTRVGGLQLDLDHHEATWHGRSLQLTPHELKVLACLARSPGRVWTYERLHEHAWGEVYFTGPAAVQSVIKRLRAKLRGLSLPVHIDTVRGLGFRLVRGNDLHLVS